MSEDIVRRSIALPRPLVDRLLESAPPELANNFNGLVREAVQHYITDRERQAFADSMALMAHDPALQAESGAITEAFRQAEGDGLQ